MKKKLTLLQRRQFLQRLTQAGALGAVTLSPLAAVANTKEETVADIPVEHKFLTKPYLQNPAPDAISVMWLMNRPSYCWLEYGEGEKLDQKAHSITDGLVDAFQRINNVRLTNLKPGTTYSYRVMAKDIVDPKPNKITYGETIQSQTYSFITPKANPKEVSCLIYNDIHDRPESIPHLYNLNQNAPADFVFFNGDMFNHQQDEKQIIDHLLEPCASTFAATTPFLMVRGNHETRGVYARELHHYFANKDNRYYYTFNWGPVHFTVIDTGEDKVDTDKEYSGLASFDDYRRVQAQWLEKEMQTKAFRDAKFRVVFMHIPHFYANGWHGPTHCNELFAPLFNKYKVDISISGHTHKFGVHPPVAGEHNYPIIIGGGPKDGNRTLIKLKADQQNLTISMLKDDGSEVGKYALKSRK